jgi:hypothetical protein
MRLILVKIFSTSPSLDLLNSPSAEGVTLLEPIFLVFASLLGFEGMLNAAEEIYRCERRVRVRSLRSRSRSL